MPHTHYLLYVNENLNFVQVEMKVNEEQGLMYHIFTEEAFVLGSTSDFNNGLVDSEFYYPALAGMDISGLNFLELFYFKNNVMDFTKLNKMNFRQAGTVFYRNPI